MGSYPIFDLSKAVEMYEKLWKEYPEYERIKSILEKIKSIYGGLATDRKISWIDYYRKTLEIDKFIDKENYKKSNRPKDDRELFGEYPKNRKFI